MPLTSSLLTFRETSAALIVSHAEVHMSHISDMHGGLAGGDDFVDAYPGEPESENLTGANGHPSQ